MSFSFLNPWMWMALIGIAAPIWLHLHRRNDTHLFPFSAVRFLFDQPIPQKNPLRLQQILLFALRVLGLTLITAAFTWPYIRQSTELHVTESRVYILDNTLSRQVENGFTRDRDRLIHEIASRHTQTQIAVIELTSAPRVIVPFGENRESAVERLKELQPSYQRGSFLAAMRQANSLLGNSLGQNKQIIFLTDNQENQWAENESTPPFLQNVQVQIPDRSPSRPVNMALAEPRIERLFLGDKSLVQFSAKLLHQGSIHDAQIVLKANNQIIIRKPILFSDDSGFTMIQAQWESDPSLWIQGELSLESQTDALGGDNQLFFSAPPVEEGKLILLARSKHLRLALSPEIMRGRWSTRFMDPSQINSQYPSSEEGDVLCVESDYLQSSEARKMFSRYLSNGKGVLLLINRITVLADGFLKELGFETPADSKTRVSSEPAHLHYFYGNHPIFHPFLSSDFGNLTEIRVFEHHRFEKARGMPLIFSSEGEPLFFQAQTPHGKLFISTFGFQTDQSNWPVQPTFIPFLDLCFQHARPGNTTPTIFEPGEIAMLPLSESSTARNFQLTREKDVLETIQPVGRQVRVKLPSQPGLYHLKDSEGSSQEWVLCVNPSAKESLLSYNNTPQALKAWQFPSRSKNEIPLDSGGQKGVISLQSIFQQRIWWYLLVFSFAVLGMEILWLTFKPVKT